MQDNLGRHVKWEDSEGGWHTGRVVTLPGGGEFAAGNLSLVRESCDGKLSWVSMALLKPWKLRSKWTAEERLQAAEVSPPFPSFLRG